MQFLKELKTTVPRPFTFGPVRFDKLNVEDEDVAAAGEMRRSAVSDRLSSSAVFTEKPMLIHGVNVKCKGRKLKRRTTVLKHSRFLQNMLVTPVVPKA